MVPRLQDSLLFRSFGRLHRPAVVPPPTETPRRRKNLVFPVVPGAFFVVLAIINVSFTQDIQQTLFRLFFLHFFFVWRPPHPLHPHLLCTRKSEARTDSPGAFVCWSTAPNPRNHAVRRMTDSPMFYRLTPMLPRCAGRMLLKPENTAAKQMSDKCQTNVRQIIWHKKDFLRNFAPDLVIFKNIS